jgi:hypothetical protein
MLRIIRGTLYEGPERQSETVFCRHNEKQNQVLIKVALKSSSSVVQGEPSLYGGLISQDDGTYQNGDWVPLGFRTPHDPNTNGWPRKGAEVIIYEDLEGKELWAETLSTELPAENYKSLDKIGPLIIVIGS